MYKKSVLALILSLTAANSKAAIEPEIYIGGMFNFNSAVTDQGSDYTQEYLPHGFSSSTNENNLEDDNYFAQDAYVDFLTLGRTDDQILYGGKVTLQLDSQRQHNYSYSGAEATSPSVLTQSDNSSLIGVRRAFVFLEDKGWGRVELGDVEGASKKMKFDAAYKFGGTGGIAGNWWRFINIPSFATTYGDSTDCSDVQFEGDDATNCSASSDGAGNKSFMIRPDLPLAHGYNVAEGAYAIDDTRTIGRISYYSPRMSNVQFGLSYGPDSGDRGASYYGTGFSGDEDAIDVIDWGVNFVQQFDNSSGIAISYTGEMGEAEATTTTDPDSFIQKDLFAHALGFYGFYGNFNYSASYGDWGDSLMFVMDNLASTSADYRDDSADYYTIGFGYQFGAYKFSFANLSTTYREQEFSLNSLAFDYRMSKNLTIYGELNQYDFSALSADQGSSITSTAQTQTLNSDGHVLFLGMKMTFGGFNNPSSILLDTSQQSY